MTKDMVREESAKLGLPTANKPSYACYGAYFGKNEAITPESLAATVNKFMAEHPDAADRVRTDGNIEPSPAEAAALERENAASVGVARIREIIGPDVLLAAASNAIIVGFQVRPSASARKLAEKEEIEIRLYSIIYDDINDIKDAIEGMLEPVMKEEIVASVEVLEIFKISKVGTVAGCYVLEGTIRRGARVRVLRDHVVIHEGELDSLKRFKEDVREVKAGYECGLSVKGYNDIQVGDQIEVFEVREVARELA